jgi:hypothetical protein
MWQLKVYIFSVVCYFMLDIRFLVENLGVFEGNKVPLELKVLGSAFYMFSFQVLGGLLGLYLGCKGFLRLPWK